ncbi:MAG: glycosyl hydrolase, partial [Verrucomicrobia bacterium]|nr:glycosyl hydrolase [Verrucomicrobiota bacterium]
MKTLELVKLALLSMQRNSWEQGVAMDAFFEQGDRDVVIALAKEAAYRRI